jgi:predicted integral membrane protein DUF2269
LQSGAPTVPDGSGPWCENEKVADLFQLFLLLHVLGAIVVFGPVYLFPVIARQGQLSPQNGPFAIALGEFIERRIVIPGAIVQGITGVALILIAGRDLTIPANRWLIGGIILYAIAITFAIAVQAPNAEKMVHLTSGGPPPGPPQAGAPSGPPPEIAALGMKLQRGGMLLTVLVTLIVVLMVTKPGF